MKKSSVLFLSLSGLILFTLPSNAYYQDCYTTYTPNGYFRDCREMYVSQVIPPPMMYPAPCPPPPLMRPRGFVSINYMGGRYPGRYHHHPHHHGGLGASFHISI